MTAAERQELPRRCPQGHARAAHGPTKRLAYNSIRRVRASLFIFFERAKLVRRCSHNPVRQRIPALEPRIQHYAPEILRDIGRFIVEPASDPTAALLLYFITFHLTTVQELRYLRLPTVVSFATGKPFAGLAHPSALTLPRRQASLGITHPGRPGGGIDFHQAARHWLAPLLARFEVKRASTIGPRGRSRYVFATARGSFRDVPVSPAWIWQQVTHNTRLLLGVACNPNTLRKTAAVYFADRVGAGVLNQMGWEAQQAFTYTWATRELIDPSNRMER